MTNINRTNSRLSGEQILREVYNPNDDSLTVSSFVDSKVGNKIVKSNVSATVETYSYYDGDTLLKVIQITYTSSSKNDISEIERLS
jgi:hypothetical protein